MEAARHLDECHEPCQSRLREPSVDRRGVAQEGGPRGWCACVRGVACAVCGLLASARERRLGAWRRQPASHAHCACCPQLRPRLRMLKPEV